ncbi:sulfatase [Nocardioides caldifontis]|uniref:sulfatase family protein n=1 Tax=Nocardioides caldifontis TaxID=2588938 RepID=UPI0011E0192C|nr:sulfatase [Nocardioides caldifontis]
MAEPNIVLITVDDATDTDLEYMPRTLRRLKRWGTEFRNGLATHPLCGPARAQLITGQYAQDTNVWVNKGRFGGYDNLPDKDNTLAAWLQAAGYRTGLAGKFMNGYSQEFPVPAGWDRWRVTAPGAYKAFGFTVVREDGSSDRITDRYTADWVADRAIAFARAADPRPFFMWASFVAPHNMLVNGRWKAPVPAPRHANLFPDEEAPSTRKPSFNETDLTDKPDYLEERWEDNVKERQSYNALFRARIRSLQAVDEGIARMLDSVSPQVRRNTLWILTSDNGFLLGEHRMQGKNFPYEESLHVPLILRWQAGGIPTGVTTDRVGRLIDIPATILDAAGATAGRPQAGQSLLPIAKGPTDDLGEAVLIQGGSFFHDGPWAFQGVRKGRWKYVEHWQGQRELYDLTNDPFELANLAGRRPAREAELKADLDRLSATAQTSAGPAQPLM